MIEMYYIGIDLGGTNIKAGICDENGAVIIKDSVKTHVENGLEYVVTAMAELWVMQSYLHPDLLESVDLRAFDAWAANFGRTHTALELAPDRIKVNAICPGNFLDGPLWTDPVKGLFVQYLAAGKVPGAKTVEDVKKSYESKVPLGRGCLVKDVVRAILYIMEQEYETGQAVPVTGGQEMLK